MNVFTEQILTEICTALVSCFACVLILRFLIPNLKKKNLKHWDTKKKDLKSGKLTKNQGGFNQEAVRQKGIPTTYTSILFLSIKKKTAASVDEGIIIFLCYLHFLHVSLYLKKILNLVKHIFVCILNLKI